MTSPTLLSLADRARQLLVFATAIAMPVTFGAALFAADERSVTERGVWMIVIQLQILTLVIGLRRARSALEASHG